MEKNMEEIFNMYKEFGIDTSMADSLIKKSPVVDEY